MAKREKDKRRKKEGTKKKRHKKKEREEEERNQMFDNVVFIVFNDFRELGGLDKPLLWLLVSGGTG